MRLCQAECIALAFPQLLPSLLFPLGKDITAQRNTPRGTKVVSHELCTQNTHIHRPKKNTGHTKPQYSASQGFFSLGQQHCTCIYVGSQKSVICKAASPGTAFAMPELTQLTPVEPQQLSRVCPPCSALVSTHATNLSASGDTENLSSQHHKMPPGPAFPRHSTPIYSSHPAAIPCAESPARGEAQVTLQSQGQEMSQQSKKKQTQPSQALGHEPIKINHNNVFLSREGRASRKQWVFE